MDEGIDRRLSERTEEGPSVRIRNSLVTIHLWVGLVAAPFLFVLGLTGAVMVFENEIADALNARLVRVQPSGTALSPTALESRIQPEYPGYRLLGINLPPDANHAAAIDALSPDGKTEVALFVDPYSGKVLGTAEEQSGVMGWIHGLHTHLQAGRTGSTIVASLALVLLFLSLSGLILWWPTKLFSVRWRGTAKRVVFEAHNALGIYAWVFLLLFSVTGAVIHWDRPVAGWIDRLTGAGPLQPLPRSAPACAGRPAVPADRLLGAATAAVPGARATWLQMAPDPTTPVRVVFKYPEDHTPAGRTQVFLEACSAKILTVRNARQMPASFRYTAMWNRELHTGDIFGWPTRILAALFSLSLPLMGLTGPLIWWTRRRRATAGVPVPVAVPESS